MRRASPFFTFVSASRSFGTAGRISLRRFEGAPITMTPIANAGSACWKERLRSTVTNTSKTGAANLSGSPFEYEAHPISGTVFTSCPMSSRRSFRGTHSSSRIFTSGRRRHPLLGLFQERDSLFAGHGREVVQEFIKCFSTLDVINKSLNGHACACETGRSSHKVWIGDN